MPRFALALLCGSIASHSLLTSASYGFQVSAGASNPPAISAITERVRPFVAGKEVAGAVTLVATPDRIVHLDATGKADIDDGQADAAGHHLLDRLDDQAGHGHRRPDAPGRGQAVGRRPGREVPAGVQGPQDRGRQAGAGHDPPPAHAHLGHGRDHAGRGPRHQGPGRASSRSTSPSPSSSSRARSGPTASRASTPRRGSSRSSRASRSTSSSSGGCSARWG